MRFFLFLWIILSSFGTGARGDEVSLLTRKSFTAKDTLANIDEPSADARKCLQGLVWPAAEFTVRCEKGDGNRGDLLVRFPTPVVSGDEANDLVCMEWYIARDDMGKPVQAPAVVVVHESGSGMTVGRLIARGLREMGLHAFMIQLPHYGQRRSGEKPSAALLIKGTHQAVADVRRARDAVAVLPLVDGQRIALQGTSLGGFVSATSASLDGGYDTVFLLLAGGDLYDLIQNGEKDAAKVRAELAAAGLRGEPLKAVLHAIEPTRIAHRLDPARTWLYSGKHDTVVPIKNADALAKAAGLAGSHHIRLEANHYSGIIYLPIVLKQIADRITSIQATGG